MKSFLLLLSAAWILACCGGCASLSYPEPTPEARPEPSPSRQQSTMPRARMDRVVPADEAGRSWSDLTREARELRQQGEYVEAQERLVQAALQVESRPPTDAQRRAVFGMQARLAEALARDGETERADELADELFEQAEQEPELGGAALISLALSTAERREGEVAAEDRDAALLPLLRIALTAAETRSASRDRMDLASFIAAAAFDAGELDLARRAIDRAVGDADILIRARRDRIASMEVIRAEIAMAQGDLVAAEASATRANQIYAEIEAQVAIQAVGEARLAEILSRQGEIERARLIALGAYARIGLEEQPLDAHSTRRIVAALARVQRASGEFAEARRRYEEALSIPGVDQRQDNRLVSDLARELQDLESPEAPSLLE